MNNFIVKGLGLELNPLLRLVRQLEEMSLSVADSYFQAVETVEGI